LPFELIRFELGFTQILEANTWIRIEDQRFEPLKEAKFISWYIVAWVDERVDSFDLNT